MRKYKTGLIIGRFQPFHLGHVYLIENALEAADKIIIGIGSSNVIDENNPFDLTFRKKFLEEFISHTKIQDRISNIIFIPDVPDDNEWLNLVQNKSGNVDVVVGDNEWVNGIYEAAGVSVLKVGHFKRETLQGTKIRKQMKQKKQWQDRVPDYLIPIIEKKVSKVK